MSTDSYQEVAKAGRTLMLKEPFYGLFLIGLNKELSKGIQTACIAKEGINLKLVVNPEYFEKQDTSTRVAILKHEMLHVAFQHLNMFDDFSDKKLLNVAADLEINQYISNEMKGETWEGLDIKDGEFMGVKLPLKAGTRVYYDLLQKELDEYDKNNNPSNEGDVNQNEDGQGSGDGMGSGDQSFAEWFRQGGSDGEHTLWEEFENLSEAEKKLIQKQIDHQLKEVASQTQRNRGTIPGELSEYIDKLFEKHEAVIDWKQYLRRFGTRSMKIETKKTRKKPNIRFGAGPAIKIKPKRSTLVAIDTSGSVSEQDLIEFFNEIDCIHKTGTAVTIMECDSYVHRTYQYAGKTDVLRVSGRGGTSFDPVMEEIFKAPGKYQNLIYLTDGFAPAPQRVPMIPILWVINSSARINDELPGAQIQIKR
mgnify:FL=1